MSKIGSKICQNSDLDEVRRLLAPHTTRAYLVGGCVRDTLLGREIYDYDIEIYDIDPHKFDALMQSIGASGVGKSYFIYKFKNFDLGLPRSESKTGERHKDFAVSYINDPRTACLRRDFTINAMMMNIFDGELLDFYGGRDDLRGQILRHINEAKFCEDALRVLRGVQFSARLGFTIVPETLNLMKKLPLENLSRERINAELIKFFKAPNLHIGARYLFELNLLGRLFGNFTNGEFKGLCISRQEFDKFNALLKNARKFVSDERLFIYLLCGYFGLDARANLERLKLPKSFFSVEKEPFFLNEPSDFELIKIALKKPLKFWLGCYDESRIDRAKGLKIYDEKFNPDIKMSEILTLGLRGEQIGVEIKRRQEAAIREYLTKTDRD